MVTIGVVVSMAASVIVVTGGVAAAGASTDPCKLLKVAEIEKVLGHAPGPAEEGVANNGLRQCYWTFSGESGEPPGSVGSVIATGELAKSAFESGKTSPTVKRVRGIKNAYFLPDIGTVAVKRGGRMLNVQVLLYGDETDEPTQADIVALTKIALKRLET
jgi:hypothetical protein